MLGNKYQVKTNKGDAMLFHRNRLWLFLTVSLLVLFCAVQASTAWEMIPPKEPIKNANDDFGQNWRSEASQQFGVLRNINKGSTASFIMISFFLIILGVLLHLMVRFNHMERTARMIRSDMLRAYTRMWLISRWGFRY
jgi:hypothetical protein